MIVLLKELEQAYRNSNKIGSKDLLHIRLYSDGSGFLVCHEIKGGKVKERMIMDFGNLASFILQSETLLGKEIAWRDQ